MNHCTQCGAQLVNGTCPACGWTSPAAPAPANPAVAQPQYQPYGATQDGMPPQGVPQQGAPYGAAPASQTNVYVSAPQYNNPNVKSISKVAYILLTWLTGVWGVHRFMRGQVGLGILYIFTLGGVGFAVLVDLIIALVKLSNYSGMENYEFTISPRGHWTR